MASWRRFSTSKEAPTAKDRIDLAGSITIVILTILWGINYSVVKVSNTGLSPVFTTFLRSLIATGLGIVYCLAVRQPFFHRGPLLLHGIVAGILFGLEFICMYLGLFYTNAARAVIFVYLSPFFVAIGAHFFLQESLDIVKTIGLCLAFFGIYLVFKGKPSSYSRLMLFGDLLEILAAVFWGATTIYIKRYLAERVHPINTFLYQFAFSMPIMLFFAYMLEPVWVRNVTLPVVSSVFFQSVIVAFASYLVWFNLIHTYPVAKLSVFTSLTPVFGVLFGILFMKEQLTAGLLSGLMLVCLGIYCTNYRKKR